MAAAQPAHIPTILPDSARWSDNELSIGDCRLSSLAEEFGTPLYVYDEATLRTQARALKEAFSHLGSRLSFGSKACALIGILRIFREEGLHLDVVSEGEMEAALRAGFEPSALHLHGNCKSQSELTSAVTQDVHAVVVDNLEELRRLAATARAFAARSQVMLRLRLPLEAKTHPHLQTTGDTSKFGLVEREVGEAMRIIRGESLLHLIGIHVHLGSQISDVEIYAHAAREMITRALRLREGGACVEEISIGGGWAVAYRPGDLSLTAAQVANAVTPDFRGLAWGRLAVEPGRSLVARAAVALYRVGSVKTRGQNRLIAVDGGMGDNPRPALYGARYHAVSTSSPHGNGETRADIVGRYCESGDVLARDVSLPAIREGDLVAIPVSGAYQVSMGSTYNHVPQPAVVLVSNGEARLLARRGAIDDLFARESDL